LYDILCNLVIISETEHLVPKQYSTGGQTRLLGISKRGDSYLRKLL